MAEKTPGTPGGRAPTADGPAGIRNVALIGHTGAGKTTLIEALLAATGTIPRAGRVEDGTTVADFDEAERRHQRSINLAVAPLSYAGIKVNLLDTPGYPDFVGDLRAGLRAADCALFVVAASDGIDGSTRMLWDECAAVGMPRAIVVTKLDKDRTSFAETLAACQEAFGDGVAPLYETVDGDDGRPTALIGLLSHQVFDYASGTRTEREPSPSELESLGDARNNLIESVIAESEDETLMDRYLGGEDIDVSVLTEDLETAVSRGSFYPVLASASPTGLGMAELLDVMTGAFPSPLEHVTTEAVPVGGGEPHAYPCDPAGPLLAEVVKTTSDPYVGRISLVRVFSGTLRPDTPVHVSGHASTFYGEDRGHEDHDEDERVGALSSPLGATQRTVDRAVAGDICAIAKLTRAETGDTLSDKDKPLVMRPWTMPEPLLPVAVQAQSKADEDKLSQGLARVAAEDPTLRVEHNPETHQLVLWCLGEAHADVVLDRLATKYGVKVDTIDLRVPMRATFSTKVSGRGSHVKQSGGHGQFAKCEIDVEPLPSGSGFEFVDKVFGGSVPRQFIPSVEKGIRTQMERGVAAGYPVVDLRVTLLDGKAHSVDSSDMAFQTAGALALKDAATRAPVSLLEPVDEVAVLVPDEYLGAVMSDMSTRRGRVSGTEPIGQGRTLVRAEVPQTEIVRYAIDLRSMSHGTGTFSRTYLRYEPMPAHLASKVTAEDFA